jgi:AAA domain
MPPKRVMSGWPLTTPNAVRLREPGSDLERRSTWQSWHVRAEAQRQVRAVQVPTNKVDQLVELLVTEVLHTQSISLTRRDDAISEPGALRRIDGSSVCTVAASELLAAAQLRDATGAQAEKLAKLTWSIHHKDLPDWAERIGRSSLVIIDEAGMADTLAATGWQRSPLPVFRPIGLTLRGWPPESTSLAVADFSWCRPDARHAALLLTVRQL